MDESKKDDENIAIDFGKIKNFFKSNKEHKEQKAEHHEAKADDKTNIHAEHKKDNHVKKEHGADDDISFDFSRLKKIFKSEEKEARHGSDEITIDVSRLKDFFSKYGIVLIALIPIVLSIYVRMQAGVLPITDQWAETSVLNNIRTQISAAIDQQYPNLPQSNRQALVENELQKIMSQSKAQVDEQIKATSAYFKAFFQDESGKNYMPDIDPYYWVRYVNNIIDHGHPGDILKDNKPYDNHQLAPAGRFVQSDMFHAYFWAHFYKVLRIFAPGLSVMRSMFYYPVFISALCVLLVFLIGRKIAGTAGGFFAAMMMAITPAYLGRTLFGHADTDVWVVLFPLLVTWLFVIAVESENIKKVAIVTLLASFFTGIFPFAWTGWWYIFDFLLITIGLTFLYLVFANFNGIKKNIKMLWTDSKMRNILVIGILYFIATALFVSLFSGFATFRGSFLGPLSFPSIKAPVLGASLWPNVLTTVAELNEGSVNGIINSIGGQLFFFISLLGIVLAIISAGDKKFDYWYAILAGVFYGIYFIFKRAGIEFPVFVLLAWIILPVLARIAISVYRKESDYDFKLSILLSLWIISTIFASLRGIRFTLLLAPAFSVAFGVALGRLYQFLIKVSTKEFRINKAVGSVVLIALLLILYINPIKGAVDTSGSDVPIINDAWYNALAAIKADSSEDAVITSWWDFGHHFKQITDRKVTFDGTTQTYPAAHWVGHLLMISDEKEAMGILRMLDCGNYLGFDAVNSVQKDFHKSLEIVDEIVLLDRKEAEERLNQLGFNEGDIKKILDYTHCSPPEAYFIASEDMIGKSGVWGHFGSWNFERSDIWQNARKMTEEEAVDYMTRKFSYTKERAKSVYSEIQSISGDSEANSWIAPWPGYGGTASCSRNANGLYECSNGFNINMSSYDVFGVGQDGVIRPKAAAFPTEDGMIKKEFNGTVDIGITVVPRDIDTLDVIFSSKELTGGMFTRMFYMQGHGLRYFKPFNHQRGLTGTDIYVYKIDWQGKNATIISQFLTKPETAPEVP